jgi:membrane protease subunit (stomatin/prohibitin family)
MGLLDAIKGQFIDVIEWLDDSNDTLAYRFERQGNEIKTGARLIVRPGQEAIFVNEGSVADEFPSGTYTLETKNLPILTTLGAWKHGFNSPFKAEVYFFNLKQFTGLKWGTPAPITLRDPELGPVRLRAFGSYAIRVSHPRILLQELISTDSSFETGEVEEQLRAFLVQKFITWIGGCGIPVFDFAANYTKIGEQMVKALKSDFADYGLELTSVVIESIGLPPEVEAAIDKRTQMGILGDMNRYTQFQVANAVEAGAVSGGGNPAMEMAMGVALGNQMMNTMQQGAAGAAAPPPLPQAQWHVGIGGQQVGPLDAAALSAKIAAGEVTRETLVWKAGMAGWVAASEVPEVASLFGAAPPPLPK